MNDRNIFTDVVISLGDNQAYFPGTGGNISFKSDKENMLIKASGRRISHMMKKEGVVALSFQKVKNFFWESEGASHEEQASLDLILAVMNKEENGRPSIETGFHTLLGDAVIHSHSAFVNIASCSTSFEKIMETIFFGKQLPYMCLPYAKPGYHLTRVLLTAVRHLSSKPRVFFMKNHGVIVSAQTLTEAVELHEQVNHLLKTYFGCDDYSYPRASLRHFGENLSQSATPFLTHFVQQNISLFLSIEDHVLFPDLSVFCDDIACVDFFEEPLAKITIEKSTGSIFYETSKQEAHCIEENLVAYAFLLTQIKRHNLTPEFISKDAVVMIQNMEQEKYRKLLLQ